MSTKPNYLVPFFSGSFYFGILLIVLSVSAMAYEWLNHDAWYRESLIATLVWACSSYFSPAGR